MYMHVPGRWPVPIKFLDDQSRNNVLTPTRKNGTKSHCSPNQPAGFHCRKKSGSVSWSIGVTKKKKNASPERSDQASPEMGPGSDWSHPGMHFFCYFLRDEGGILVKGTQSKQR
jgi:hypothetical protein